MTKTDDYLEEILERFDEQLSVKTAEKRPMGEPFFYEDDSRIIKAFISKEFKDYESHFTAAIKKVKETTHSDMGIQALAKLEKELKI